MGEKDNLIIWFTSDFGGCGHLRSIWINEALNSYYGSRKIYEGLATSRFIVDANIMKSAKHYHFQRQITNNQLDYMKFVKKFRDENNPNGLIFYDMDDRITDIPDFNYAKPFFSSPQTIANLTYIFNMVDIITVSTDEMANWVNSFNPKGKVKVIDNYIPKTIYRPYDFIKKPNKKPKVVWAGSQNHYSETDMGDFKVIYDLIVNTINEFDWVFVGVRAVPKWISHLQNKIETHPWVPIVKFPMILKSINADFGVAPLIPDIFNDAKSNIKLLDYWSSDLITLCSPLKPYVKENEFFFSGDWKADRDLILNIFNNEEQQLSIRKRQNDKLNKYWLEDNLNVFLDLFNIKH